MRHLVFAAIISGTFLTMAAPVHGQMVALPRAGWIATASSSNGGEGPWRALDADSHTRWTTGTAQTPGQFFKVDMITSQSFSQITLDSGGSDGDNVRNYEVYVSDDGVSWGTPVASGSGSPQVLTIAFPSQTARFICIVQTGSAQWNWWSIHELHVYGGDPDPALAVLPRAGW